MTARRRLFSCDRESVWREQLPALAKAGSCPPQTLGKYRTGSSMMWWIRNGDGLDPFQCVHSFI